MNTVIKHVQPRSVRNRRTTCRTGSRYHFPNHWDMGQGKSSLLDMPSERFPEHVPVYFDATNKDLATWRCLILTRQTMGTLGCA